MASKIRILRSTGATAPGSLEYGELAITVEEGTAGTQANKAGRLFIGNASGNPVELGGEYTYKLMDHVHGELINSSAAIVDSSGQIDGWSVAGVVTATRTNFTDTVTTNLNVTGVSTFAQGLTLNGDVTIGDSHLDTLTVNARPGFTTDATFSNNLLVSGLSTFTGAADFNGGADFSGGSGLVVSADGINVTGVSTFNSAVVSGSTIDVDGQAIFDDITVSAAATVTGALDVDGGANVAGGLVANSAQISDLTDNRVVIVGASGELEDDANFTFDGTTLDVDATVDAGTAVRSPVGVITALTTTDIVGAAATFTTEFTLGTGATKYSLPIADGSANQILQTDGAGSLTFIDLAGGYWQKNATGIHTLTSVGIGTTTADTDGAKLNVLGDSKLTGDLNVTGVSTFGGLVDINNNVTVSGTLDVDAQAIFDDVTVSAAMTVTGAVDLNGGLDVSGAETVLSSATVSDLTDNRVVIAGASGALEDDGNLTYDGTDLSTNSLIVTDLTNTRVLFAGSGGAVEDSATLTFNGSTFTAPDLNVTADARVGGGLTVFGNLTVEGTETIINVEFLDVQDKEIGVASTSTASNTTANGGGFFVHGGSDGDKQILWFQDTNAFEPNVNWYPRTSGDLDLGNETHQWRNIFIDGLAELDDVNVSSAATIATVDINGGAIDGVTIGGASAGAGTFTDLTGGNIQIGVTGDNEIDTSSGNLTIDSAGGTTTIDDILSVSGNATFSGTIDVDGQAIFDDVTVSAASTFVGLVEVATVDINGGNIDGTVIGAASSAAATLTTVNYTSLTGGDITATGSRVTAGDVTFTNLRVTGVSTVASLFLSSGTNTNGAAYFDANGQLQSTATPSAGIQTSNFILTTNASGVPSWTDTIDCGQF